MSKLFLLLLHCHRLPITIAPTTTTQQKIISLFPSAYASQFASTLKWLARSDTCTVLKQLNWMNNKIEIATKKKQMKKSDNNFPVRLLKCFCVCVCVFESVRRNEMERKRVAVLYSFIRCYLSYDREMTTWMVVMMMMMMTTTMI